MSLRTVRTSAGMQKVHTAGPDQVAAASVSRALGGRGGVVLAQTTFAELRGEEELQAEASLGLTAVARVVLETVGEHQTHI